MKKGIVTVVVVGSFASICGCKKEGPTQRAGREVDKAVEKIAGELGKAGDHMDELLKKVGP
ncbi:hypothetical protein KOM00_03980 [Geomonas sp. Red69]|uniref:Small secreted protein n=1 Tax=Geomonas diazotrophica TaxID=2843197 RepID=A0ABX8JEV9_9BACT|nr:MULTISPECIES: hypothetical protein [Geomonas]MBU5635884.1 hypothetical protein [Geomonas diazotrophica]QWV96920.1 hypothetical protein KP005_16440 [Geomonas nitrogeniifigens]QXE86096.1 hypothetical protein KP003_17290 [Geomonas nitrogeniifigens]